MSFTLFDCYYIWYHISLNLSSRFCIMGGYSTCWSSDKYWKYINSEHICTYTASQCLQKILRTCIHNIHNPSSTLLFVTPSLVAMVGCCCTRSSQSSATTLPSNRALFLQMFQKIIQSSLFYHFVGNTFISLFAPQPLNSCRFFLLKYGPLCIHPFSRICCRRLINIAM